MNKMLNKFYIALYKIFYKVFSKRKIDKKQCTFCTIDNNDKFENLLSIKEALVNEYKCYSCFGKINSIYKAYRTAKKIATSKFIFLNAAYTYTSIINIRKETKVIQLWHAAGAFKKFGIHSIKNNSKAELKKQKYLHGYYNYVIVSSENVINTYSEAFNIDRRYILPLGLPRIQNLVKRNLNKTKYINWINYKYSKTYYKKIILYAPTFREIKGKRDYSPTLNIKEFANQLTDNFILAIRLHPRSPKNTEKYPSNVIDFTKIPQDIALICSDILISDYSSIIFDFCSLNKPLFFYTPDEIMYNRGLYFSPKEKYPNITFCDFYDLANSIILLSKNKIYKDNILKNCKLIYDEYIENTNNSIKNIYHFISNI